MKIFFLIPVYNEARTINSLFSSVGGEMERRGFEYKIFAVNDGSNDSTGSEIKKASKNFPVKLIDFERNRGPGAAFRAGFESILSEKDLSDSDIVVSMEADATSDLVLLEKMLEEIKKGSDVVVASCYAPEGKVVGDNFLRLYLSKSANFLLKILFPLKIHTYTGFYRAYKAEALKKLFKKFREKTIQSDGFDGATEVLLKFQKSGAKVSEVPMVLKCGSKSGGSKMKVLKTIIGYLKLISRNFFA